MNVADVFIAIMAVAVAGMIGARLFFIAIHWPIYRREPSRIWRRGEGGGAVLGALVLAIALSPVVLVPLGLLVRRFLGHCDGCDADLVDVRPGRLPAARLLQRTSSGRPARNRPSGPLRHLAKKNSDPASRDRPHGFDFDRSSCLVAPTSVSRRRLSRGARRLNGLGRGAPQPLRDERDRIGGFDIHRAVAIGGSALALIALVVLSLRH